MDSLYVRKGTEKKIKDCAYTIAGYRFAGWSTKVDGDVEYNPGDMFDGEQDLFLYAVWDKGYTDLQRAGSIISISTISTAVRRTLKERDWTKRSVRMTKKRGFSRLQRALPPPLTAASRSTAKRSIILTTSKANTTSTTPIRTRRSKEKLKSTITNRRSIQTPKERR